MITLVLTNRNRDLKIVKNCLQSLHQQTNNIFELFLVDYGSDDQYKLELKALLKNYPKTHYIDCPVKHQLWHKCRAINIALKQTVTPYFIVGDIDLIFAPTYIEKALELRKPNEVHYFQYGFLSQKESCKNKSYDTFKIDFKGTDEVTGNTLFPTSALKTIQGYDEFYHGWGAEDTDVHIRMKNAGYSIFFYNKEILVKHQWHPKVYRSKFSTHPFHSELERINHAYMLLSKNTNRTTVNQNVDWGIIPKLEDYEKLNTAKHLINLKPSTIEVNAILAQMANFKKEVITIEISDFSFFYKVKNYIKKLLGEKYLPLYSMSRVNNMVLETVIKQFRNNPYSYHFDRKRKCIQLTMYFKS